MIPAYSELYSRNAREAVGTIFHYAINECKLAPNWAAKVFCMSGISKLIQVGNPAILSAISKEECAYFCLVEQFKNFKKPSYNAPIQDSKEYWAGSILALIQHQLGLTFREIFEHISFRELLNLYDECHRMERVAILETIKNKYFKDDDKPTKLKQLRLQSGFSQSELAEKSGVALRMIQLYEQKVNLIDNAQAGTLCKLSIALGCNIEDLLELNY